MSFTGFLTVQNFNADKHGMVWYGMSLSHATSLRQAYDTPPKRVVGLIYT